MKYLSIFAVLATTICFLNGCASTGVTSTGGDPVPGEKVTSGEERMGAGITGTTPSAQVKW